jgi:hypothetical protein
MPEYYPSNSYQILNALTYNNALQNQRDTSNDPIATQMIADQIQDNLCNAYYQYAAMRDNAAFNLSNSISAVVAVSSTLFQ